MATETATSGQLTGCVKWFDNGLNYGFITVLSEGEHHNTDIFVHQSNIQTKRDCFRTLYTGECVQFTLAKSDNEKHPYHAVGVVGYNGTMLHCENPNYRPRGFRGGRGRGNGRGGFRPRQPRTEQSTPSSDNTSTDVNTSADAGTSAVVSEATSESVATTGADNTTAPPTRTGGRGRGRGRGSRGKTA